MLQVAILSLLLSLVVPGTHAENNWDVACKGECSYDIPDADVSASMKIAGASHAVSDITPAGGWTILSCKASALTQDIRLVCNSPACSHLFEGHGAIDTLVRLPETCGAEAFARVADIRVDSDQSLPSAVRINIQPGGNSSTVYIISVDTDFASIDTAKTGPVAFTLEGYNYPVENLALTIAKRDPRELKIRNWTAFNSTNSFNLPPLNIDQTFPLFTAAVSCPNFSASVSAGFSTKVHATVSVGLIAVGTIIPPVITQFAVYGGLDGSVLATLELDASATGSIDTGKVSLYSTGLGGINFPGIFSLGPTFTIYGELVADLDAQLSVALDLSYIVDGAKVFYPPETQTSGGGFKPANTSLELSVLPGVALNGKASGRIIPEVRLGLQAFGVINAAVYFDLEAGADVALDFKASANGTVSGTGNASAGGSVDGCVDIGANFAANVGAEGSLFGLISKSAEYTLYSNKWDLYNKCFEASGSTKAHAPPVSRIAHRAGGNAKAGLTCPTSSSVTSLQQIIDQIVTGVEAGTSKA
ncbi:hypothetical protein B0H15DRAFT_841726 [Mycena belliarum]|uniref:DUF7223 domain-containing protein n=1 Tax=Mycena belliarum TaxID=1033014 RepID=A0AAD6U7I6_9AGAR|nr:hypothetical protein B0H15DRAFT_841726 [Mycena belliae]